MHKLSSFRATKNVPPELQKAPFFVMICLLKPQQLVDLIYRFMYNTQAHGKLYLVYTTAGANNFPCIHSRQVKKHTLFPTKCPRLSSFKCSNITSIWTALQRYPFCFALFLFLLHAKFPSVKFCLELDFLFAGFLISLVFALLVRRTIHTPSPLDSPLSPTKNTYFLVQ